MTKVWDTTMIYYFYKYSAFYNIYSIYAYILKIDYKDLNRRVCNEYLEIYKYIMTLTVYLLIKLL